MPLKTLAADSSSQACRMLVSKPGLFLLPLRGLPQWRAMKAGEGKRVFKPSPPGLYQQLNVPSEGHNGNPSPQYLSHG